MDVEGVLEVGADEGDAVAEGAGDEGGQRSAAPGGRSRTGAGSRGAAAACPRRCPGMTARSATRLGVAALGDDLLQQLVGNGEVEQHLVGHGVTSSASLSMTSRRHRTGCQGSACQGWVRPVGPSVQRRGHGERALGQHAEPGPGAPLGQGSRPRPGRSGRSAPSAPPARGRLEAVGVAARPRPGAAPGRAPGPARRPPLRGPSGRTSSSALGARPEDAGEGAVGGHAVAAGGRHHDDPAVRHHPLGRGHPLDRLIEVAVERVAAVGGEHHVEAAVDRCG